MTAGDPSALDGVEALPERVRLFHIGPPKTGTSNLQATAAVNRERLLDAGVLYPGSGISQRSAVASMLGRAVTFEHPKGVEVRQPPSPKRWNAMMAEIEADHERRIWFGHEYAAGAAPDQVKQFVDSIGPRIHVLVTLRSFTRMMPSVWQQYNKAGNRASFDPYAKKVLSMDAEARAKAQFHLRHDHGALVRRWADAVGPENMTVVILDPHDHRFAFHAFEHLLGLEEGFLAEARPEHRGVNRSMSMAEIELLRQLNRAIREQDVRWEDYEYLLTVGGYTRMLVHRRPGESEPPLEFTPESAELANQHAERIVGELQQTGVRLIGNVEHLLEPARVRPEGTPPHTEITEVPIDAAVQLVLGTFAAATGLNSEFEPIERGSTSWNFMTRSRIQSLPTEELQRELKRRNPGGVRQYWRRLTGAVRRRVRGIVSRA